MTPSDGVRRRLANRLAAGPGTAPVPPAEPRTATSLDDSSTSAFYDSVSVALDATPLGQFSRFLNYGYADSDHDEAVVDLPTGTLDRASVKLVLELVGDHNLADRLILDVGSGRGGTAATLLEYCAPREVWGVELSPKAVAFCRRSIFDPRAKFIVGDAQRLPIATAGVDVVTSVESAHCYPDAHRFHAEVRRVIAPGGSFLYTDILPTDSLSWRRNDLRSLGLEPGVERDITAQVLAACDLIAERRQASFDCAEDTLLGDFLAVHGSDTYEAMRQGKSSYFIWRMRRD